MRYWINTVSRDHVQRGLEGGFTQANHGKQARLKRLGKGDRIAFYSPYTERKFTAIGEVIDEIPFEAETGWRRRMRFFAAEDAPIQPLIEQLEFITNKKSWGFPFRRGLFEIGEADFNAIARAMRTLE
ncbi:MAG: EVE domain-containing protein [Acidobacteriota bacterium]|nr:EVE domain-containing protein [Acidobacteriota bacterium]